MRLIDADVSISDLEYDIELNTRLLDDTNTVGFYRELCWTDKSYKENAIQFLKDAPSVEAIPIKWLYEQSDNPDRSDRFRNACDLVAMTWLEEKEEG